MVIETIVRAICLGTFAGKRFKIRKELAGLTTSYNTHLSILLGKKMDDKNLKKRKVLEELHRKLNSLENCFTLLEAAKEEEFDLIDSGLDLEHAPTYVKLTETMRSRLYFLKTTAEEAKYAMRNYRLMLNGYSPLSVLDQSKYDEVKEAIKKEEEFPETLEEIAKHGYFHREEKTKSSQEIIKQVLIRIESKLDKLHEKGENMSNENYEQLSEAIQKLSELQEKNAEEFRSRLDRLEASKGEIYDAQVKELAAEHLKNNANQMVEPIIQSLDRRFDALESKLDSQNQSQQ